METTPPRIGERPLALVAMGGHAFIRPGERGTIGDQERNAELICNELMVLVRRDYNLIITHGNGPQVGELMLRNELAGADLPPRPLDVLVADTEGSLGYILQQALLNHIRKEDIHRYVVTVVTQVLVDRQDPAFENPTKPVGPFLSREDAERRREELGWNIVEDSGRGWRRVVPSPKPTKVVQHRMIRDTARQGHIVIACGGGGIPIMRTEDDRYEGVEAVVDKDLTAAILAKQVEADLLVVLTAVDQVYLSYGKPDQRPLSALTIGQVEKFIGEGHFPPGSMGPKMEAMLWFLRAGGRRGLITCPELLSDGLNGRAGTHFVGRC
ncbi:MAG: carbamate kinase [Candidatus Schekmanbacteria bacterium]|nr:carbamate kinase [Candidatus Schekmanbacteria bacterium]